MAARGRLTGSRGSSDFVGQQNRYRLYNRIAEDSTGSLWEAMDTALRKPVTVRVFSDSLSNDPGFVEGFRRELRAAFPLLEHRGVAQVINYNYGEDGPRQFVVMEPVQGETVAQRLQREGPFPPDEAFRIAAEVADALLAAHQLDLVHGGLTPQNVVITKSGEIKLLDFGVAGVPVPAESGDGQGTSRMSPEKASGAELSSATDVHSLADLTCQMLAGQQPPEPEESLDLLASLAGSSFAKICQLALDRDPDSRPSLTTFSAALKRAQLRLESRYMAAEEAERLEAARAEAARIEAERAEAARAEAERLEAERAEAERQAAARLAARAEETRQETERLERERLEAEREKAARLEAERARPKVSRRAARQERKEEKNRIKAAEQEAREEARLEAARLEAAQREAERQEAARAAADRLEKAKAEAETREAERLEKARQEAARQKAKQDARDEKERLKAARRQEEEAARAEAARAETARRELEREEAEKAESARLEAERAEEARKETERAQQKAARQAARQGRRDEEARQKAARRQEEEAARAEAARAEATRKEQETARRRAKRVEQSRQKEEARAEKARLKAAKDNERLALRQDSERLEAARREKARQEAAEREAVPLKEPPKEKVRVAEPGGGEDERLRRRVIGALVGGTVVVVGLALVILMQNLQRDRETAAPSPSLLVATPASPPLVSSPPATSPAPADGMIAVPNVAGLSALDARTQILDAGLTYDGNIPTPGVPGMVLGSDPPTGERVAPGTPVKILIGAESERLQVEETPTVG